MLNKDDGCVSFVNLWKKIPLLYHYFPEWLTNRMVLF